MNAAVSVIPVDKKAKYTGLRGGFLSWTGAIFFYMLMKIGIGKKIYEHLNSFILVQRQDEVWSDITVRIL